MLDALRKAPDRLRTSLEHRGMDASIVETLQSLDLHIRSRSTELQVLQAQRNRITTDIAQAKRTGASVKALMEEAAQVNAAVEALQEETEEQRTLRHHLDLLPNILADDVPYGASDADNVVIRQWGIPRTQGPQDDHVLIGKRLGMMHPEAAADLSGQRFMMLSGGLARLERALAYWMLDTHAHRGVLEVAPPLMVRDAAMFGVGQLPKFAEESFQTNTGHRLIPTAEVPLTAWLGDQIHDASLFPLRMMAHTPCFRSEAGAAGRDTRGLIRMHQFMKVELVSATLPEQAEEEHEAMLGHIEALLQALGLPYRVVLLCSGDTGFASCKTYDVEVWLHSQDTYREISSCSWFGTFQAARLSARFRYPGDRKTHDLHTLNGSALAISRTVAALLEYYVQEDGTVSIPSVLHPYMGGCTLLKPASLPV